MSEFRRHDKIQHWLNRPMPWNAVSCYLHSPATTGDWMLGSTLIMGDDAVRERAAPETVDTARVAHLDLRGHR